MCCHMESDKLVCVNVARVEMWDYHNTNSADSCHVHIYDMLADGANTIVAFA